MTDTTHQHDPAVTSLTAKAGDKVDNYTIMEQVGAGGTAIVFRGHDHVLNRNVAIKQIVVPPGDNGEDIRQRALAESAVHKQAAASDPRLLVQYIDTINDPRGLFLISEYVDGPSLEWILQQEPRPMDQRQALGIIAATAKALDALHRAGIVHRDLKPSNILMPREGGLKLADFGLAAIIADQQSLDLGSVRYMAPEILQGQPASPKSDLYALGMIAYEMLAGRDQFNDAFRTILRDQRNQAMRWVKWHTNARAKVTPLSGLVPAIPESLSQLVARMMEKDPARRVGSAAELIDAIRSHFASGGEQPAPSPHAAMAPPKIDDVSATAEVPKRSKLPIILAAMLVFWAVAIGIFFYMKEQDWIETERQARAALVSDIESADRLMDQQKWVESRDAFAKIPPKYPSVFNPSSPGLADDLVAAGQFKADALIAASDNDFITALDKAQQYAALIGRNTPLPEGAPKTGLSQNDATSLIEQYRKREARQQEANEIQALLDDRKLDEAIEKIRLAEKTTNDKVAQEDLDRLAALKQLHKTLSEDQRIVTLLADARVLRDKGEVSEAIELLGREQARDPDNLDERVSKLLQAYQLQARKEQLAQDAAAAKRAKDVEAQLAALEQLQEIEWTQVRSQEIRAIKIDREIALAEQAIRDHLPEKAEGHLDKVVELDPENAQEKRLRAMITNARSMVAAINRADQLMAAREWEKAIEQYKLALSYGPDSDGTVTDKIRQCEGQWALEKAEAAYQKGDVKLAQAELDFAKIRLGNSSAADDLQARIDDLRDYTLLVTSGDTKFAAGSFGPAKKDYLAAKKISDNETINQKIQDCDFNIWLDQCRQAIVRRNWDEAGSALDRAEDIKTNDQTRALREKIRNRTQ